MLRLAERQQGFSAALRDPDLPVPPGLVDPDGKPSARRFAVYRNNVAVALTNVLAANFPVIRRLVGEAFFNAMARAYACAEPPVSPTLFAYGAGFAAFIERFDPVASLPYLPDVARLEQAWRDAYHAPEAEPLSPEALRAIPAKCVPATRFVLHPSLRLIRSRFPVVAIWTSNLAEDFAGPLALPDGGETALVTRPAAAVEVRTLPRGGAAFLEALRKGHSLQDAVKAGFKVDPSFDLSDSLRALIEAGALAGLCDDARARPQRQGGLA